MKYVRRIWMLSVCLSLLSFIKVPDLRGEDPIGKDYFVYLNNPVNSGFGAVFSSVLCALNLYDSGYCKGLKVNLDSGVYLDPERGSNWWEYFFEPIDYGVEGNLSHVLSENDVHYMINNGFQIPREKSYELIEKYVHLKPHMQAKIDHIYETAFQNHFVIGIHHRGTDKVCETPLVPFERTLFHLQWWMGNLPSDLSIRIFVATDDLFFVKYLSALYPNQVMYNQFVRSQNTNPTHYNDDLFNSNYQKGEEAVIDCFLLSKCNLLFFPAGSAFSMAALKFNPYLKAIALDGH